MRIIIELDGGLTQPEVQVGSQTLSSGTNPLSLAQGGKAIDAGSPKVNAISSSTSVTATPELNNTAFEQSTDAGSAGSAPAS